MRRSYQPSAGPFGRHFSLSPSAILIVAKHMAKKQKQDDPLYTVARYTTTQVAEMLGIKRVTVHSAIQRGTLESELASVGVRLVSQAAIDAYRADHLGQVGKPSRKKQRMKKKMAEAQTGAATEEAPVAPDGSTTTEETHA